MPGNPYNRPKSPQLDMNPMVDMAFLLVTFFLLATTFKTAEPTRIVLPRSVSPLELPDNNVITITINKAGSAYIGLNDAEKRILWLERFASLYEVDISDAEKQTFSALPGIGVPADQLASFLKMQPDERQKWRQPGIPKDSVRNELTDWIVLARTVMPRARVAIKADKRTPYHQVDDLIKALIDNNILRFNLITEIRRIDGI
jgi:biopolymer transport protein ExbD